MSCERSPPRYRPQARSLDDLTSSNSLLTSSVSKRVPMPTTRPLSPRSQAPFVVPAPKSRVSPPSSLPLSNSCRVVPLPTSTPLKSVDKDENMGDLWSPPAALPPPRRTSEGPQRASLSVSRSEEMRPPAPHPSFARDDSRCSVRQNSEVNLLPSEAFDKARELFSSPLSGPRRTLTAVEELMN